MGEQQELFERAEDFLRDLQELAEEEDTLDHVPRRVVIYNADTPAVAEEKENAADFFINDEGRRTTAEETHEDKRGHEYEGVNLALKKPAAQPSTEHGGVAELAVDGNTDGTFNAGSCTHTNYQSNPWWRVDLGSSQAIGSVVVFNRQDCCQERLNNFRVHVGDSPTVTSNPQCGGNHAVASGQMKITVDCNGQRGRYVGISIPTSSYLTLCEVQVFGAAGSGGSGGTVYTRWGRTTCPSGVTLLYEGIAGGTHFTQAGGANYVCLPKNPEWGNFKSGNQGNSYIYGAEYQVYYSNPFQTQGLDNHDVPCAVCHVPTRGAQVMIPARLSCPSGWTREYKGYLMAERFNHKRSEFVCVDEQPEVRPSGQANVDGALFYPVDARCGSLPCPPYVEGHELTCVVCTK
ncbi:uncharacterized protein LOC144908150 [Branchiostoma floridae x Branchiostoma belcheri]